MTSKKRKGNKRPKKSTDAGAPKKRTAKRDAAKSDAAKRDAAKSDAAKREKAASNVAPEADESDGAPSSSEKPSAAPGVAAEPGTIANSLRISAAVGVAAAVVVAVLINILGARHYKRWDWTDDGLYTISRATEQTLKTLPADVELYVLLSKSDPLSLTVRHLLEAYQALTNKLVVRFVDPDRDPKEFLAVQQKYGIAAGRTEDGRVVTDASIVVVQGERKHFITSHDMVEVNEGQENRARSKVEQTLTAGIRLVVSGDTPRVCFTTGHGEPHIDEGGSQGLLSLHSRLDKLNYQVEALPPLRGLDGADPIDACKLVVVAGPSQRMEKADVMRLVRFVEGGGNALAFVGPELDPGGNGFIDQGLAPLLALGGVRTRQDLVFEQDPKRVWVQEQALIAEPKPHPITRAFIELGGALPIVVKIASSLELLPSSGVNPFPLIATSDNSFGMRDFVKWAENPGEPEQQSDDAPGPLMLAYAVELPKTEAAAEHGPRMVIFGTKSPLSGASWNNERLQGTALLVESTVSWLATETVIVDIPTKPVRTLGATMTQGDVSSAALKFVILLPLSVVLMGIVVGLRRRIGSKKRPEANA